MSLIEEDRIMAGHTTSYDSFNFVVNFDGGDEFGCFAEVSLIDSEAISVEYRNGNEIENHVRTITGVHKFGAVTLKRGLVNNHSLWDWVEKTRTDEAEARKKVNIVLLDEAHNPVQAWVLRGCILVKYTGPTLAGKGDSDVAIEEIVLAAEGMEVQG